MMVEKFLDMCNDIEQLASLIDRALVIHEDIAEEFIAPIRSADEKQDFKTMLTCASANNYNASIKSDIQYSLLSEAWTMAHSLVTLMVLARKEQYEKEAADTQEGANPSKGN